MGNQSRATGPRTFCALLSLALFGGCTAATDWLEGKEEIEEAPAVAIGNGYSESYLQEMFALANGDPATQAEIYADARAAARLTPDTSSRLRYALVLATPGHASNDPDEAQAQLREILAEPELLTPTEKALATIWLQNVEARLVLNAEAKRLRAATVRAETTENVAISERIASVEAENRQLREALTEAEQKLEAITSIERSIREQSDEVVPQQ